MRTRLILVGATAIAVVFPTAPASADPTGACPDFYEPVPVIAVPNGEKYDRNQNFIVCAKGPQGSNGHFNVTDDKID